MNLKKKYKPRENSWSKDDNSIVVEWIILEIWGWRNYVVKVESMDLIVNAYASWKLFRNKIVIMKGDKVQIKLNEYDPTRWIIIFRLK